MKEGECQQGEADPVLVRIDYDEAMEMILAQINGLQAMGQKIERDAQNGLRQSFYRTKEGQLFYQAEKKGPMGFTR